MTASEGLTGAPPPLTPAAWLRWDAVRRGLDEVGPSRVLEVGAGEGAMGWRLARRFDYVGLEPDPESFRAASSRFGGRGDGRIVKATTEHLSEEDRFDLICAFEVLEHLADDRAEVERWRSLLRPGGSILISVPAHRGRFGPADRAAGHVRRYDRADLTRMIESAGYDVRWVEAWGAGLGHLLEWFRHRVAAAGGSNGPAGTSGSGRWLQPRHRAVGLAFRVGAAPFRLLQRPLRRSTVGIGWVALADRRP